MEEGLKVAGYLEVEKRDASGKVVSFLAKKNLIVDSGKTVIAKMLGNIVATYANYIQIGTGTTPVGSSQVSLVDTNSYESSATNSYEADFKLKMIAAYTIGTFPASGVNITEAGVFDGPKPSGVMISRQTFDAISVNNLDSLTVTWRIIVS